MSEAALLLAALQHADSGFPGGGLAFSWGLETLIADGLVRNAQEVEAFVGGQLEHRWATADRPALAGAWRDAGDLEAVVAIDERVETLVLARELREGSGRAGRALLGFHRRLSTPGAAEYEALARAGRAPAHLPVVQGLLWCGAGLALPAAEAMAAHGACLGAASAALRLGILSHVDSQRIVAAMRPRIARILAQPAPGVEAMQSFAPAAEIAAMRHEVSETRLFIN